MNDGWHIVSFSQSVVLGEITLNIIVTVLFERENEKSASEQMADYLRKRRGL
jgi:hypothetical protein